MRSYKKISWLTVYPRNRILFSAVRNVDAQDLHKTAADERHTGPGIYQRASKTCIPVPVCPANRNTPRPDKKLLRRNSRLTMTNEKLACKDHPGNNISWSKPGRTGKYE